MDVRLRALNAPDVWLQLHLVDLTDVYGVQLASVLTVEDRRGYEKALIPHSVDSLASRGIHLMPLVDVQAQLNRGLTYGFYLWAVTLQLVPAKTAVQAAW